MMITVDSASCSPSGLLLRGHGLALRGDLGGHGGAGRRGAHQVHRPVQLQQVRASFFSIHQLVNKIDHGVSKTSFDKGVTFLDANTALRCDWQFPFHRRQVEEILLNAKKHKPAVLQVSFCSIILNTNSMLSTLTITTIIILTNAIISVISSS